MKPRMLLIVAAVLPSVLFASPLPEKAELLASNTVVAQYVGVEDRPCFGRTALCPDRCDHAVRLAKFRVLVNEAYEKPGKYGDEKAETGNLLMLDAVNDVPGQDDCVLKKMSELKPGQLVRITQNHYYADLGSVMAPIRPVAQFELLNGGTCAPLLPIPHNPANHDHEVMPLPL